MKNGEPTERHHEAAEKHLMNLFNLWTTANLNFTLKVHSILVHALKPVKLFNGIF